MQSSFISCVSLLLLDVSFVLWVAFLCHDVSNSLVFASSFKTVKMEECIRDTFQSQDLLKAGLGLETDNNARFLQSAKLSSTPSFPIFVRFQYETQKFLLVFVRVFLLALLIPQSAFPEILSSESVGF